MGSVDVVSNQIHNGGNENAAVITTWAGSLIKQWSEALFISGPFGGPTIFNDGGGNFYLAELNEGSAIILYKVTSGSFTNLGNSVGLTTAGHTYRIRVETVGTITISDNGSDMFSIVDSSLTTGRPGIRSWSNYLDDWKAGDFNIIVPKSIISQPSSHHHRQIVSV
jgi:hypothetical protein